MIERRFAHLEFKAGTCDPKAVANSIRASGCALLRGAMPPVLIQHLEEVTRLLFHFLDVRETYAGFDGGQTVSPKPFVAPLIRFDVLPAYAKMIDFDVLDTLFAGVDRSVLPRINQAYFPGGKFQMILPMSMVRRQAPADAVNALPFHQDGANYAEMDFLNFWMPLTPAGEDSPGLEVVPRALDGCLEITAGPSAHPLIELDEGAVAARYGAENFFRPVLAPGDVLIMNQYTIHRTFSPRSASRTRSSFELRVLAA